MKREQEYQLILKLRLMHEKILELRPRISKSIFCSHMTMLSLMKDLAKRLKEEGFDLIDLPLGHDLGHVIRDCRNAILIKLDKKIHIHPLDLLAAFFAGTLHDTGLIMYENRELTQKLFGFIPVSRYQEKNNFIRHAEAGALLIGKYLNFSEIKLSPIDIDYLKTMIVYSIAAHTKYLREFEVEGKIIQPYKDTWEDGAPILPIIFTQWCDRMDCIGPYFFVRHFCTLLSNKEDYTIVNGERVFHKINLEEHMYPFALTEEQRKTMGTMRTHMEMFLNSQNESSPYGKNDIPGTVMVSFREHLKKMGWEIIAMLDNPLPKECLLMKDEMTKILKHVSSSNRDEEICLIVDKFMSLPDETKIPWLSAFTRIKELISKSEFPMEEKSFGLSQKIFTK